MKSTSKTSVDYFHKDPNIPPPIHIGNAHWLNQHCAGRPDASPAPATGCSQVPDHQESWHLDGYSGPWQHMAGLHWLPRWILPPRLHFYPLELLITTSEWWNTSTTTSLTTLALLQRVRVCVLMPRFRCQHGLVYQYHTCEQCPAASMAPARWARGLWRTVLLSPLFFWWLFFITT